MIVDYYEENASELRANLEANGIQVVEWARAGSGWMSAWQKLRPDFVFVELQLPKRDGLYCLTKLKELEPAARVVLSHRYQGMMANEVENRALSLGALAVLQRPYTPNRFRVTVGRLLELIDRERKMGAKVMRPV